MLQLVDTNQDVERRHVQRELHDGLGPLLAGIGFGLAALERSLDEDRDAAMKVRELRGQVREAIAELRRSERVLAPARSSTPALPTRCARSRA